MAFTIPHDHRSALEAVLKSGKLNEVANIFGTSTTVIDREVLISALSDKTGLPKPTAQRFLNVLVSMIVTRENIGMEVNSFVDEVLGQVDASPESRAASRDTLVMLLGLKSIIAAAKTSRVANQHERAFVNAQVISGLAAAFSDSDELLGMVTTHELQISFLRNGDRQKLSFGLDSDDLQALLKTLMSAVKREASLDESLSEDGANV